jgi:hypothetical protein
MSPPLFRPSGRGALYGVGRKIEVARSWLVSWHRRFVRG